MYNHHPSQHAFIFIRQNYFYQCFFSKKNLLVQLPCILFSLMSMMRLKKILMVSSSFFFFSPSFLSLFYAGSIYIYEQLRIFFFCFEKKKKKLHNIKSIDLLDSEKVSKKTGRLDLLRSYKSLRKIEKQSIYTQQALSSLFKAFKFSSNLPTYLTVIQYFI